MFPITVTPQPSGDEQKHWGVCGLRLCGWRGREASVSAGPQPLSQELERMTLTKAGDLGSDSGGTVAAFLRGAGVSLPHGTPVRPSGRSPEQPVTAQEILSREPWLLGYEADLLH